MDQHTRIRAADFGARPDGKTVCTGAIQQAIEAAAACGGMVVFEKGVYLTGSLFLKSGIVFEIGEGVELRGAADETAYPAFRNRVAGVEMVWPGGLLNVCGARNVRITGGGTVDGQGAYWWEKYWGGDRRGGMRGRYEEQGLRWAVDYDCRRPRNLLIYESADVTVENLTLLRSGFWNVHICYSQDVIVSGLRIRENQGPSTDGIDIDSSSHVTVSHCSIDCNDDSICIKSGRDADGLRVNRPSEHILVHDCETLAGAGITIGSETAGGVHHVQIRNIVQTGTACGIRLKSARTRGGVVSDIRVSGLRMTGVQTVFPFDLDWNPAYSYCKLPESWRGDIPAHWKALLAPVDPARCTPEFHGITIENVKADCLSRGQNHQAFAANAYARKPIADVTFSNIDLTTDDAGSLRHCKNWRFEDSVIRVPGGRPFRTEDCENVRPPLFQEV